MSISTEAETMGELIADCGEIPRSLQAEIHPSSPAEAPPWAVDDGCHAQVAELDFFI